MIRVQYFVSVIAIIAILLAPSNSAEAFRIHRNRCCNTCTRSGHPSRGDVICLQYKMFPTSGGRFAYAANFLEGDCYADPWPFGVEYEDVDNEDLPQDCFNNECLSARCVRNCRCGVSSSVSGSDRTPAWEPGVTQLDMFYMKIRIWKECRTYKAQVFEIKFSDGKRMYVAFAIDHFPPSVPPHPLPILLC